LGLDGSRRQNGEFLKADWLFVNEEFNMKKTLDHRWAKDHARHGGSAWKVFKAESNGLRWYKDANQYGDFIEGKHKGPTGMFVCWTETRGLK
jgi:hypothetical protein